MSSSPILRTFIIPLFCFLPSIRKMNTSLRALSCTDAQWQEYSTTHKLPGYTSGWRLRLNPESLPIGQIVHYITVIYIFFLPYLLHLYRQQRAFGDTTWVLIKIKINPWMFGLYTSLYRITKMSEINFRFHSGTCVSVANFVGVVCNLIKADICLYK